MIKIALLSVSDKTGLAEFARFLHGRGVVLLSTGGTAKALREAGLSVVDVSEHTGFPEIMDGRVKTLHPKIHGGLLGKRKAHASVMREHSIAPIDLLVVNLYPFEQTVARGAGFEECIENIDIGGPSMIRSGAKNFESVTVVVDPHDYAAVQKEIEADGDTRLETRQRLSARAFARTAAYDAAISGWFAAQDIPSPTGGRPGGGRVSANADASQVSPLPNPPPAGEGTFPESLTLHGTRRQLLHYGENPHQKAAFYATGELSGLAAAQLVQGDRLSYNNLNDAAAALELAAEFTEPAVVIVKHANPCGVAVGKTIAEAYAKALASDPVSAYGGIIAVNRPLDAAFANALGKLFVEVLIAPDIAADAAPILALKKKMRVLAAAMPDPARPRMALRSISGGFLYQEDDAKTLDAAALKVISKTKPSAEQLADMRFAFTVAKHVKSNAIVLARGNATLGIGAGQMSRIDSTRLACWKAREAGLPLPGAVLASDAFFPFPDNVKLAAEAGIAAIIQPGGSIRDEEVIKEADALGIAMVFTGMRHFRH